MKTFLKVLLVVLGVIVAVKLLPLTLAAACVIAGAALVVTIVGVSAVAGVVCLAALIAVLLSPLWLPVAMVFGIVALVRGSRNRAAKPATAVS